MRESQGDMSKHRDSKLRFSELLPVSVAFQTSHTALEADCPGNSGTKQEVPFTKSTLESHSLLIKHPAFAGATLGECGQAFRRN